MVGSAAAPVAPDLPATCSTFPEFSIFSDLVTTACCTGTVVCPPGGIPSSCTADCAAVLRPMQQTCGSKSATIAGAKATTVGVCHRLALTVPMCGAGFLTNVGMAATMDAAVATCPAQCPADRRPADTRSAECIAADLQDETKAILCRSE